MAFTTAPLRTVGSSCFLTRFIQCRKWLSSPPPSSASPANRGSYDLSSTTFTLDPSAEEDATCTASVLWQVV